MAKKRITACLSLVALAAFALPASALAANEPEVVENGTRIGVPTKILATNTENLVFMKTDGVTPYITCTTAKLTGTLTKNNGTEVEGSIEKADFSGTGAVSSHNGLNECTANSGEFGNIYTTISNLPLTVKSTPAMANDEAQLYGPAGANVKFITGSTLAGPCEYESTSSIKADYTTSATTSVLTLRNTQAGSGTKLIKGSFLCPSSSQLKMKFNLETDGSPFTELGIS